MKEMYMAYMKFWSIYRYTVQLIRVSKLYGKLLPKNGSPYATKYNTYNYPQAEWIRRAEEYKR